MNDKQIDSSTDVPTSPLHSPPSIKAAINAFKALLSHIEDPKLCLKDFFLLNREAIFEFPLFSELLPPLIQNSKGLSRFEQLGLLLFVLDERHPAEALAAAQEMLALMSFSEEPRALLSEYLK